MILNIFLNFLIRNYKKIDQSRISISIKKISSFDHSSKKNKR
jgi:hypothetical protein